MRWVNISFEKRRLPAEPSPSPVREPVNPPENPDMPVRKPNPDDPHDMSSCMENSMIRKLKSGQYRLYSRKKDRKTGRRRNLGTFGTRKAAQAHEQAVQYFKRRA